MTSSPNPTTKPMTSTAAAKPTAAVSPIQAYLQAHNDGPESKGRKTDNG